MEEASPIYIALVRDAVLERLESRVLPRPLPLWLARPPIAEIFRCRAGLIAAKPRA